jgi:hypothetical protein
MHTTTYEGYGVVTPGHHGDVLELMFKIPFKNAAGSRRKQIEKNILINGMEFLPR